MPESVAQPTEEADAVVASTRTKALLGSLAATVSRLQDQVRALEDNAQIMALIASYGPLVDSGDGAGAADLWTPEGTYEVAGFAPWVGRTSIATIVEGPGHLEYLARGSAHAMGLPRISLSGDRAVAVNYTQVFVRDPANGGWGADRASVHRWNLVRTDEGWRVESRVGHALDGSEQARDFLSSVATRAQQ